MEKRFLTVLLFTFAFITYVLGQESSLYEKVRQTKELNVEFIDISSSLAKAREEIAMRKYFTHPESVSYFHYTPIELNSENRAIRLTIPIGGRDRALELVEASDPFYDYEVETPDGEVRKADRSIRHFRGIIEGVPNSFVAISFNKDKMFGIVSTNEGNYNIAPIRRLNKIVVYDAQNLNSKLDFICGTTDEYPISYSSDILMESFSKSFQSAIQGKVVWVYLETRYNIYQSRGSINAVEEYISSIVNQLSALFQKEGIQLNISKIYIWNKQDPYTNSGDKERLLSQFQDQRTDGFDGDLGQLLTFENIGGLAAGGYNGLCNPDARRKLSLAGISRSGDDLPSSSNWSVCVMAHELGHLLGSKHTHACAWNGNNTAIDGCYKTEGNCTKPAIPTNGGTIMSYCHLQDCGINLSLGFGPQPGNVIRNSVRKATCLSTCSISGSSFIFCNNSERYTIQNLPAGASVRWNASNSNLQLVSGQGTREAVFSRRSNGKSAIKAQITINGSSISVEKKDILVGERPEIWGIDGYESLPAPGAEYYRAHVSGNTSCIWECNDKTWCEITPFKSSAVYDFKRAGIYIISATGVNDCGRSETVSYTVRVDNRRTFSLSPNPATDVVTLKLTEPERDNGILSSQGQGTLTTKGITSTYEIQLWSGLTMLKSFKTNQPTFQISIAGLPAGLYFMRVIKDGQTYTEKLIKN